MAASFGSPLEIHEKRKEERVAASRGAPSGLQESAALQFQLFFRSRLRVVYRTSALFDRVTVKEKVKKFPKETNDSGLLIKELHV